MVEDVFSLLHKPLLQCLTSEGVVEPSEIQRLAIPAILRGENLLLVAPTGTGKTYAALLPILNLYLTYRSTEEPRGISILYITPLRALNRDLMRRLMDIAKMLDVKIQVRHGDTAQSVRQMQARFPPNMLITTPETLQAILPGKRMKEHLKNVRWVVVDEIHELVADKRGAQLSVALERLRQLAGREFQRVGLSATIGDEAKVAEFLSGFGRKTTVLRSEEVRKFEASVEYVEPKDEDHKDADRLGVPAPMVARAKRIRNLLLEHSSTLVFTNTRESAEALGALLRALDSKLAVRVHHGSLSREIREEVEKDFQEGLIKGVVCTSSLELGIDVGTVDFTAQYMSPREASRLIQRIGRSGHQIRAVPRGCVISSWADDILESSVIMNFAKAGILEAVKVHENAFDVLAHQTVGLALDLKSVRLEDAYKIVKGSYIYRNLQPEDFVALVKQLEQLRILRFGDGLIRPNYTRAFKYYYENLSMIPDVKRYTVMDFISGRRLGHLDQEFVARRCRPKTEFIMHGYTWKIVSVDEEKQLVKVEPTTPSLNAVPSWEGEIIPVDYQVALEVGRLRGIIGNGFSEKEDLETEMLKLGVERPAAWKIVETVRSHIKNHALPTNKQIVIENYENCVVVHACFGNLVNEALGLALASILHSRYGVNIATQIDQYRIALISPFKMDPNIVAKELSALKPNELEKVLESAVEATALFAWRHWHVARRLGAVERKAEYRLSKARLLVNLYRDSLINREAKREILLEKLDLEKAKSVAEKIVGGEISIIVSEQKGVECSPLALPIVDKIVPHDLLRPVLPTKPLVEIVRERLLSATVRLVCMFNADWEGIKTVETLPKAVKCRVCNSTLIAVTYPNDMSLIKLARKKKREQTLSKEEEETWGRAWKSASLVQTSGRKAVIAMSGHGVGPTATARILKKPIHSEDEFYMEILKAEREYARTRMFWK